jgi:hypothetical protein
MRPPARIKWRRRRHSRRHVEMALPVCERRPVLARPEVRPGPPEGVSPLHFRGRTREKGLRRVLLATHVRASECVISRALLWRKSTRRPTVLSPAVISVIWRALLWPERTSGGRVERRPAPHATAPSERARPDVSRRHRPATPHSVGQLGWHAPSADRDGTAKESWRLARVDLDRARAAADALLRSRLPTSPAEERPKSNEPHRRAPLDALLAGRPSIQSNPLGRCMKSGLSFGPTTRAVRRLGSARFDTSPAEGERTTTISECACLVSNHRAKLLGRPVRPFSAQTGSPHQHDSKQNRRDT